jgi:hypothetical protein
LRVKIVHEITLHAQNILLLYLKTLECMRHKHEKLPKNARPGEGGTYTLLHNGIPMFSAQLTKYDGGCWATVRVVEALDAAYKAGDSFDIRVAMYEYAPLDADVLDSAFAA